MRGIGGREHRRRRWVLGFLIALMAACGAYAWVQLARGGLSPADTVTVLGPPLTVLTVLLTLPRPAEGVSDEQVRGWAGGLARQVENDEQTQWRQLLGNDSRRINLAFAFQPGLRAAQAPDQGLLFRGRQAIPDIVEYYAHTAPGRLLVTGEPGAGKTVLALELMLSLIRNRGEDDPVPVRLSLAEWDTDIKLDDYLAQHLTQTYRQLSREAAAELVSRRRVLPVLDGLDEMDPTGPGGAPRPDAPRAAAALDALNAYQAGTEAAPLVITCRTAHYRALSSHAILLEAARITIGPVRAPEARDYLGQRISIGRDRWEPVLAELRDHPEGTLARALSTPWRLCLVATGYARRDDPAELLDHTDSRDLDDHLLARYIPAAVRADGSYEPSQEADAIDRSDTVHRQLATLAAHLAGAPGTANRSGPRTDLVPHQLWPLAGRGFVRAVDAAFAALLALIFTVLILIQIPVGFSTRQIFGPVAVLPVLAAVAAVWQAGYGRVDPPVVTRFHRLRTSAQRRRFARDLASWLGFGLVAGLTVGLAFGYLVGFAFGLTVGPAFGLVVGLALGLTRPLAVSGVEEGLRLAHPGGPVREDLAAVLGLVLVLGFAFALAVRLAVGLALGLTSGLTLGVMLVPYWFSGAGRRYLVLLCCARSRGKLPLRLGAFLDWSYARGLLRISGLAYQFRHRELQDWLVRHPEPPARVSLR